MVVAQVPIASDWIGKVVHYRCDRRDAGSCNWKHMEIDIVI